MSNSQELRRIKRKARERYTTIIDLIKNCPDKPVPKITTKEPPAVREKPLLIDIESFQIEPVQNETASYAPTETSYYIDDLNRRYKYLKIFKKRYLAHRNNRFGIGFRKRLIPTQKLLKILKFISESQEKIMQRLTSLLTNILNDENIDNPVNFNYLRAFRKWMMGTPLASDKFDSIKWMERNSFEREFKNYIINFYSFLKMETSSREELIELIEMKLRENDDLAKEVIDQFDTDLIRRGKEKRNLEKEKEIHEYISLLRSFLVSKLNDESLISAKLKKQYGIENFSNLLLMINESLVFQRPVTLNEVDRYFEISSPVVSTEKWDYNEETLKKIGKDPASRKRREIIKLKLRLEPYDEIVVFLKSEKEGKSHLMHGVEKQWELIDKKRQTADNAYRDDFFSFIDGAIQYFRNSYLQLLDGSSLYLSDPERNEFETSFFSVNFLNDELSELDAILDEMHLFKSNNPTLTLKHGEIKKIMMKQLTSLSNVEDYVRNIGSFFYRLAKKLQEPYDLHRRWIYNGSPPVTLEKIRHPLEKKEMDSISKEMGAPFPYYDCTIKEFYQNNQLVKRLTGKKFMEESGDTGIYPDILSFLYQAAHECYNDYLLGELDERKRLMRQIEEISR